MTRKGLAAQVVCRRFYEVKRGGGGGGLFLHLSLHEEIDWVCRHAQPASHNSHSPAPKGPKNWSLILPNVLSK